MLAVSLLCHYLCSGLPVRSHTIVKTGSVYTNGSFWIQKKIFWTVTGRVQKRQHFPLYFILYNSQLIMSVLTGLVELLNGQICAYCTSFQLIALLTISKRKCMLTFQCLLYPIKRRNNANPLFCQS